MKNPSPDQNLFIRELHPEDVTGTYVQWMNDPVVARYLETPPGEHTESSVKALVGQMLESSTDILFGIFLAGENLKHIGNIKIGGIDRANHNAHVGFLVGDRSEWGKGYATKAIELATEHAFQEIGLNKVWAGAYSSNMGSRRALLKAGWKEVGALSRHVVIDGQWQDKVFLEKLNANFPPL